MLLFHASNQFESSEKKRKADGRSYFCHFLGISGHLVQEESKAGFKFELSVSEIGLTQIWVYLAVLTHRKQSIVRFLVTLFTRIGYKIYKIYYWFRIFFSIFLTLQEISTKLFFVFSIKEGRG